MTQDLVETDLRTYLQSQGGDYVLTYKALIEAQSKIEKASLPVSTSNSRKDKWLKTLKTRNKVKLREAYERMRSYVGLSRSNLDVLLNENSGVLEYEKARQLAKQFNALREIEAQVKADRELIKACIFRSMTEDLANQGVQFPEFEPARIEFEEDGIYFDRYGCGRTEPTMNETRLRAQLGEDVWKSVATKQVVTTTTYDVNYDKLMELARSEPAVLEKVRSSLNQGEWKSPSLTVRNL